MENKMLELNLNFTAHFLSLFGFSPLKTSEETDDSIGSNECTKHDLPLCSSVVTKHTSTALV